MAFRKLVKDKRCCLLLSNAHSLPDRFSHTFQSFLEVGFWRSVQTVSAPVSEKASSIPQYSRVGRITEKTFIPRKPVFAVVNVGPTQFKVSPDDLIYAEKLKQVDVNDKVALHQVQMLGSRHETILGRPFVAQASVTAIVEEQMQDAKVLIFHKRRRKNSRRTKGHRQELTALRILDICGIEA